MSENSHQNALDNEGFTAEDTQKDKYLTFHLANEDYGIEIRYVTEIIGIQKITKVPDMANFIKGVINLRGKVASARWATRLRSCSTPRNCWICRPDGSIYIDTNALSLERPAPPAGRLFFTENSKQSIY
jgi:hypothetical protein